MKLSEQQQLFAHQISKLIQHIFDSGYSCTFGEALRPQEMADIYAKSGKGIKDSLHIKKLAVDLNLFDCKGEYTDNPKDYEKFGVYWESLDKQNRNGRNFPRPDANHFERRELV